MIPESSGVLEVVIPVNFDEGDLIGVKVKFGWLKLLGELLVIFFV